MGLDRVALGLHGSLKRCDVLVHPEDQAAEADSEDDENQSKISASSHGVLRALMTGMHAAHLLVASRRNEDLRSMACRQYRAWLAAWVRHDAVAMRRLYARLPYPP